MTTVAAILAVSWALPRMRGVKAMSVVEAVANPLAEYAGGVPVVGSVLKILATPEKN